MNRQFLLLRLLVATLLYVLKIGMSISGENVIFLVAIKARDLIFLDNILSISNNIYFWRYVILHILFYARKKSDKGRNDHYMWILVLLVLYNLIFKGSLRLNNTILICLSFVHVVVFKTLRAYCQACCIFLST